MDLIITNAHIVTRDDMMKGTVCVSDGIIQEINEEKTKIPDALDFEGDLLLPGLIEMHTDNLEKHLIPRPGILWPSPTAALLSHDNQISGAGITTVLDPVFIGEYHKGGMRRQILKSFILNQRLGFSIPDAVAKVSANPADLLGLDDRGEIQVGKRADMIRVRLFDQLPVIIAIWRNGEKLR